jgi:hypothetical protein
MMTSSFGRFLPELVVVASWYMSSAVRRSEKSSSAVQEVEESKRAGRS